MSEIHNYSVHNYSVHNYGEQIGAVEARIGRLALLCGADLSRPEVVIGLIKGNFAVCGHEANVDPAHRDELRALLMLKYDIKASCVDSIGTADCARLMAEQDEKLRQRGFPPQTIAP